MSTVFCLNTACSEPWESYFMSHDIWAELYEAGCSEKEVEAARASKKLTPRLRKLFKELGWEFGSSVFIIKHCACCPDDIGDATVDEDKLALANVAAELCGDDTDALQVELEDRGL